MAVLSYGGGKVSIEGKSIAGIEIHYEGKFHYFPEFKNWNTKIRVGNNKILIYILEKDYNIDGDLFIYEGYLKIKQVIVADWNAEQIPTRIDKLGFADPRFLNTIPESMTQDIENYTDGYQVGRTFKNTKIMPKSLIKPTKRR